MIIAALKIFKMPHDDPRYPAHDAIKRNGSVVPFSDVYVCECLSEGTVPMEAPFFITDKVVKMTPERTADMLRIFATAVENMGKKAAAA